MTENTKPSNIIPYGINKKKPKKITPRKKKFADKLLAGANQTQAAKAVGSSDASAAQQGYKWANHDLSVRNYLLGEMEKVGITDPYVAQKMKDGLESLTKPLKEGGERYEDGFVRKQYLDMYFRLTGMYAPEKSEHTKKTIVLNMTPQFIEGLIDTGKIDKAEAEVLEAEIIRE